MDRLELQIDGLYVPIEIKQHSQAREQDKLQLSFYTWILCQLQNTTSLPATFWLGMNPDRTPKNIVPYQFDANVFEKQLSMALDIIGKPEPDVKLLPKCNTCHWYSSCFPEAVGKQHVTLLSGLRFDTKEDFASAGIQTLDQIVALKPENLRKFRGIKTTAHGFHASARAWVEGQAIWYNSLHPTCRTAPIYFDIETIPYEKPVWSIGWAREGEMVQVVIVDPKRKSGVCKLPNGEIITLVRDADSAWRFFAKAVANTDAPLFHWASYEKTNLEKEAPIEVRAALLPRLHDLHKSFDNAVKLPISGTSLKTIGVHLGFEWRAYDDWWAAYIDYQKWLEKHDLNALVSACEYQQDDVTAMIVIRRWLAENAPVEK